MSGVKAGDLTRELTALAAEVEASRSPALLLEALCDGCWIYGAGGYGRKIGALLANAGVRILGFIDRNGAGAGGSGAADTVVVRPDEFDAALASRSALVMGLHNFAVDQLPIVTWARGLGFREILTPGDLPDLLGAEAGSYWLTSRHHLRNHIAQVCALLPGLADEKSQQVVAGLTRFRLTGRPDDHPASCLDDQYFPVDLPPLPGAVSLIDGGAFTGDTLDAALRHGVSIAEWLAFEPDPDNFGRLARYAAAAEVARAVLFPCGLSDGFRVLRFAGDAGAGSRLEHDASADAMTVHVVAVDEVLKGARPTFIKLDVEGHERQALDGMRATIERCRPRLAVSIYHEPADLWELPAKVAAMMPGARLYIRQHGFSGFDTVLYALDD